MVDSEQENEKVQSLEEQILALNDRLEDASQSSMSRAFNLGCSTGLLPAALAVVAVFYLFKGSLIGAAFTALVLALGLIAFANLSAYLARARTTQRFYKDQINPEIDQILTSQCLTRQAFDDLADQILPQQALLRMFLKPSYQEQSEHLINSPEE